MMEDDWSCEGLQINVSCLVSPLLSLQACAGLSADPDTRHEMISQAGICSTDSSVSTQPMVWAHPG